MRRAAVRSTLLVLVGAAAAAALVWPGAGPQGLLGWRVDERAAIEFLRREPLSFLVTERIVTQVVVEKHEGNLLLGDKDGILFGTVELLYGVDLAALEPGAVRRDVDAIRVRIPEPQLLRAVPDLGSVRFLHKRSPLMLMADKMLGADLYQQCLLELDDAAVAFAEAHGLAPSRGQLVQRLNEYAPAIASRIGAEVRFE